MEFREATAVDHLIWEEDRVVGIASGSRSGRELTERGRLMIGADGVRSRIAEYVGATAHDEHPSLTGVSYTYWQGVDARNVAFHVRDTIARTRLGVGDAGDHKDPTTGAGMSDAFPRRRPAYQCDLRGVRAGISLDQALRGYEQERDNRSHHIYEWTLRSAQLADPAPLVPFLAAVQDNPSELRRFMSVLTGTVPFWEVLGRDNMRRVLTGQ